METNNAIYRGAEIGPIRPPSEAKSLMLRVTRNCPWNKCRFCSLYKGSDFSIRKTDHVLADIDAVYRWSKRIDEAFACEPLKARQILSQLYLEAKDIGEEAAIESAMHFHSGGYESVFLQDANTLLTKTDELVAIITRLRELFPRLKRVTSYARSATVVAKGESDLARLRAAGLDRIHIGLESGSDRVLEFMEKGATKKVHIEAGLLVKGADIELSEYYIIGLGGMDMSEEHAGETADALSEIDPDFIRIRTLSIPGRLPLGEDVRTGRFRPLGDVKGAEELLRMIEALNAHSYLISSDHIVNLLPDVTGRLPDDKERMLSVINSFLSLSPGDQMIYRIGRRAGQINGMDDMRNDLLKGWVQEYIDEEGITEDDLDAHVARAMRRFI